MGTLVQITKKTFTASLLTMFFLAAVSPARTKAPVNGCVVSSGSWTNVAVQQQTGSFRVTYTASASVPNVDAVTGLSSGAASDFSTLAAVIRFNPNGNLDATNGSAYSAASVIPYSARVSYHFIMDVHVYNHTYDAYVMIAKVQTTIGTNLAFRDAQSTIAMLNNVGSMTAPGNTTLCNIVITPVATAPSITTQPTARTVTAGQTASFSIASTGTAPLTYQWKKNGAAISGATSSNYSTPVTTSMDNGTQFTATVSNSAGSATSNTATLTVNAAVVSPSVTTQPVSQSLTAGQSATFSVVATGTGPLMYQWSRNGAAISGAASSSYTISTAAVSDNGAQFSVLISNTAGSTTSSTATLSVKAAVVAPTITMQPLAQSVTAGQAATFAVATTGTAPMSYQWNRNGSAIGGANSSSYTTALTTSSDDGANYTVLVGNSAGNVTSIPALLTVKAAGPAPGCLLSSGTWVNSPLAQVQTGSFRIVFDATPSASSVDAVTGLSTNGAAAYQDLAVIVRFNSTRTIDAINGSSYTTTPAIPYSAGIAYHFILDVNIAAHTYDAYVMQGAAQTAIGTQLAFRTEQAAATTLGFVSAMTAPGSHTVCNIATSAAAATAPSITTQPVGRTVSAGQTASFSVTASGTATLTYQWTKNGAAISGATSASYTTAATTTSDNGAQFGVTISNAAGSVTSNSAPLTVSAAATLLLNSSSSVLNFGNVNVSSTGTQNLTLTNAGSSNVTISQVLIAGAGFNTSNASGIILSPGQSTTLTSTFAPSASGSASGSITVSSNATNSPSSISLSGNGVAAVAHTVQLSWSGAVSGVTGFNTYSSTVSGGPYVKMTSTPLSSPSFTDTSVQTGQTYYYVVTAINSSSQESGFSGEVMAIVP